MPIGKTQERLDVMAWVSFSFEPNLGNAATLNLLRESFTTYYSHTGLEELVFVVVMPGSQQKKNTYREKIKSATKSCNIKSIKENTSTIGCERERKIGKGVYWVSSVIFSFWNLLPSPLYRSILLLLLSL